MEKASSNNSLRASWDYLEEWFFFWEDAPFGLMQRWRTTTKFLELQEQFQISILPPFLSPHKQTERNNKKL